MSGFNNRNVQQPLPEPVRVHDSHVSSGFMAGRAEHLDAPITQKITAGKNVIRLDTQVDPYGNVGDSIFRK